MERTLVLIKPEGVEQNIIGAIISRFESAGLKVTALKMLTSTNEQAGKHYLLDKDWYDGMWANTKKAKDATGEKVTETPLEMGTRVRNALIKDLTRGPIVAMIVQGKDVIATVRKLAGATSPDRAEKSTIRGMYSTDSYAKADGENRAVRNVVHASDSAPNAEREILVWFKKDEIAN